MENSADKYKSDTNRSRTLFSRGADCQEPCHPPDRIFQAHRRRPIEGWYRAAGAGIVRTSYLGLPL